MGKISVLFADDHTLLRQGLKALLTAEPDMEVVGEAKNGRRDEVAKSQSRKNLSSKTRQVTCGIPIPIGSGIGVPALHVEPPLIEGNSRDPFIQRLQPLRSS